MKEYAIGEVFEDSENFYSPKRIKCVEDVGCEGCVYNIFQPCPDEPICYKNERKDKRNTVFIETEEPITEL